MAGRNRRNVSAAARLAPALKALLLCGFFVTAGVGYVWYKSQIKALGDEVKKCEITLADLKRENKIRRDVLDSMCSPVELDKRVKQLGLTLGPPSLSQVIRIVETAPAGADPGTARAIKAEQGN